MGLLLAPDEVVMYPQPYLPDEPAELIITTRRLVRTTDAGVAEFPIAQIDYVGRVSSRPFLVLGLVLLLGVGLPLFGFGVYEAVTSNGPINSLLGKKDKLPDLPPLPLPGATPAPPPAPEKGEKADKKDDDAGDEEGEDDSLVGQLGGIAFALGGILVMVGGVLLLRRQRHVVVARTGDRKTEVRCQDRGEQTVMLTTLSSAVTASRTQSAAIAQARAAQSAALEAARPPAPVATPIALDESDPVKALQTLKALRDGGKIDAPSYEAKRAALLELLSRR